MLPRRSFLPMLLLALAGLSAAGCANRTERLIQPVSAAGVAGAASVPLLVATTRRVGTGEAVLFTGERGPRTAYAAITVSVPPTHREGEIEWPTTPPGDPARDFVTTAVTPLGMRGFAEAVATRARRGGRVLVFVHGFNTTFAESVYRFAQVAHDLETPAVPVLFTWPSRGQLLAYAYDRESATYSRDALEEVLRTLASQPAVQEVTILAHSMGTWVTLEALRQMAIREGRVSPKIRDVLLAAPDVDVDVARTQVDAMGERRPRFTLFVSRDDRALDLSRLVWGNGARLGSIDPRREPFRTALARARIDVVDLTAVGTEDPLNHTKFAEAPDVVQFIGRRLSRQEIGTRREGLGEVIGAGLSGVAGAAADAATLAVTAPVAVVDPAYRKTYENRLGTLLPGMAGPDAGEAAASPTTPSTRPARRR